MQFCVGLGNKPHATELFYKCTMVIMGVIMMVVFSLVGVAMLAMCGHVWPFFATCGHVWTFVGMCGHVCLCLAMCGHVWPCVAM
jgi:hypothetical protein